MRSKTQNSHLKAVNFAFSVFKAGCKLIPLLFIAFLLSGCSIIGAAIGSKISRYRNLDRTAKRYQLPEPGREMQAYLFDGTVIRGKFLGVPTDELPDYWQRYAQARYQLPHLPEMGANVSFRTRKSTVENTFMGFHTEGMMVGTRQKISLISYKNLDALNTNSGNRLDVSDLKEKIEMGDIPVFSKITLQDEKTIHTVDLRHVGRLRHDAGSRTIGGGIGVFVDAALVAVFVVLFSSFDGFGFGG